MIDFIISRPKLMLALYIASVILYANAPSSGVSYDPCSYETTNQWLSDDDYAQCSQDYIDDALSNYDGLGGYGG